MFYIFPTHFNLCVCLHVAPVARTDRRDTLADIQPCGGLLLQEAEGDMHGGGYQGNVPVRQYTECSVQWNASNQDTLK